ncbi:hypothetical protein BGX29_004294 [Mortierella sp. GBA35]|nr:hypothetical protein BGX29_004294 [Mortierella sp. GBA35]
MASTPYLPLEIWFQILDQTLNLLLPTATTPRLYSTNILPLLLTSHTFNEHCHPTTAPHLRKHKLLQLFTRWKAAHSREVHFYHHPLRTHVRYALPDRVGNPPGEEYETLYSFIKRAYLFGCESVCGTVIPVEGGLEGPPAVPAAAAVAGAPGAPGAVPATQNGDAQAAAVPATGAIPTPASATTGAGATPVPGNLVIAPPPPAPAAPPAPTNHGGDGGGQGWKGHALQWHVANPTFAAEGTLELYRDVVEEYRRVVCGSAASRERAREMDLEMDRIRNPHRYTDSSTQSIPESSGPSHQSPVEPRAEMEHLDQIRDIAEEDEEDMEENSDEDEDDDIEDDESDMIERDEIELLSEIEAKGGLRRRDSGHGQSSSDMDIDDDLDKDDEANEDEEMVDLDQQEQELHLETTNNKSEDEPSSAQSRNSGKREPETMAMDYQLEGASRHRRGLRNRKMERSYSANEQERLIMEMALDKPYHAMASLSPFYPIESKGQLPLTPSGSSSSSSSSSSTSSNSALGFTRSGSLAPFTPMPSLSRKSSRDVTGYSRSKSSRNALQRSHSSPGTTTAGVRIPSHAHIGTGPLDTSSSPASSLSTSEPASPLDSTIASSPLPITFMAPSSSSSTLQAQAQLPRALRVEDLDFDLASACANTFASDLAFVLARVPGLGAHFHRFEQLAKLKLHVGWAKHAQSRGGNDVFVMSCSRLIGLLAPLANTPLVSERGG